MSASAHTMRRVSARARSQLSIPPFTVCTSRRARPCHLNASHARRQNSAQRGRFFSSSSTHLSPSHTSSLQSRGHNDEEVPDLPPPTDFGKMDVLGATPIPATSVDIVMSEGFTLNSGLRITDGSGLLLVGGEAMIWRPWTSEKKLINAKGQWAIPEETLGLFSLVWPRPGTFQRESSPVLRGFVKARRTRTLTNRQIYWSSAWDPKCTLSARR
jgi:hypothetical protein